MLLLQETNITNESDTLYPFPVHHSNLYAPWGGFFTTLCFATALVKGVFDSLFVSRKPLQGGDGVLPDFVPLLYSDGTGMPLKPLWVNGEYAESYGSTRQVRPPMRITFKLLYGKEQQMVLKGEAIRTNPL